MQIFYLCLLMLRVVSSSFHFQTKTVHVKQDVELTSAYQEPSNIFWIRIISGHWPEFLGGKEFPTKFNRISAKKEPGISVLRIREAKLNDTGLYYCVKTNWQHWTFETGYFVKVKETESDISSIIQEPPTVYPGVQTSVKCSLLSNSIKKMCSYSPAFFRFKSASDKSHPSFIYTHNDGGEVCNSSLRTPSAQRCFYSFSRNFSDAGIYHCAVAGCGHILWGQGTHLNTEDVHEQRSHWSITVLCLICAALIITVIVLVYYICSMKNKTCSSCCYGIGSTTNSTQNPQTNAESLVYSSPTFIGKKAGKAERRKVQKPKKETIYSDVVFV